jgi:hypothetical protein
MINIYIYIYIYHALWAKGQYCKFPLKEWSWALFKRSPVVRTLGSFPAFYGTRRFSTEFTKALHLSTSPHPTCTRSILISTHLHLGLPNGSFHWLSHQQHMCVPLLPHSSYVPDLSHPPQFDYSNYTWLRVQIMKLFVTQFSLFTFRPISLKSKYPPQHLVLEHPQSMFLPRVKYSRKVIFVFVYILNSFSKFLYQVCLELEGSFFYMLNMRFYMPTIVKQTTGKPTLRHLAWSAHKEEQMQVNVYWCEISH